MNLDAQSRAISIVITNWNGRALLEKFLPSVVEAAQAFENECGQATEILVADDSSSDDSGAWLRGHWPQVRFETSGDRLGFAPTANRGVKAARFPFVYLLNNDVALEPGTFPPLVPHFQDSRVFAVTGQAFDYATGVLRGAGQRGRFRRGFLGVHDRFFVPVPKPGAKPLLTLFASGGSALFDRAKFLSLGGFDEMLAPFGWEDVELSLRAWKLGFEVRYEPRSAIWHQFSSTIEPRFRRKHVAAIYERNRLLAHWVHLDTLGQVASHMSFLMLRLLAGPFSGRSEIWSALAQSWRLRSSVRARRKSLHTRQQRRLEEILCEIGAQISRPDVCRLDAASAPVREYTRPARRNELPSNLPAREPFAH